MLSNDSPRGWALLTGACSGIGLEIARDLAKRGYALVLVSNDGMFFYGASKRYLRSFAVSLHDELAPWGVSVTCLAPGPTATDLYGRTSIPVELAVQLRVMKPPAKVAQAGVRAMFAGRRMVIPGLAAKMMTAGMVLLPRGLIRAVHRWSHTRSHGSDEER
jgi:short-subunit dehydrogenase